MKILYIRLSMLAFSKRCHLSKDPNKLQELALWTFEEMSVQRL